MDTIRVDMGVALAKECERLGGKWVDTMWVDDKNNSNNDDGSDNIHDITGDEPFKAFYDETGANKSWGYCTQNAASDSSSATQ